MRTAPLLGVILAVTTAAAADRYANFADLAAHEKEGEAFRIVLRKTNSPVTIMAIHGGRIEAETSELSRKVAASEHSLYLFEGIKPADNWTLHITATHFDEPKAVELATASRTCLSVHGYDRGITDSVACIGGKTQALSKALADGLQDFSKDLRVEFPCKLFEGNKDTNIVNRCRDASAQIELSKPLREKLREHPELEDRLAMKLRSVLENFSGSARPVLSPPSEESTSSVPAGP